MKILLPLVICLLFLVQTNSANSSVLQDTISKNGNGQPHESNFRKKYQLATNPADIRRKVDALPSFGVFKDNYIVTGIPLNKSINQNTADAMFQLSIRQRMTKSWLPFNSFLFFTYTQKSFWNIYAESAPFRDNNYNPAIGVGKHIIRDNLLQGAAFCQIEHESNGRAEEESRSWNMLSFTVNYFYNLQFSVNAKIWIPLVDGEENQDLLDYRGLGCVGFNYLTSDKKIWITGG